MKNKVYFVLLLALCQAFFIIGCSDQEKTTILSTTNPEMAAADETVQDITHQKTKTIIIEEEYWDGVSPIEKGKWYRFRSIDESKEALKNSPAALKELDEFLQTNQKHTSYGFTNIPLRTRAVVLDVVDSRIGGQTIANIEQEGKKKNFSNSTYLASSWVYTDASVDFKGYTAYPNPVRAKIETAGVVAWNDIFGYTIHCQYFEWINDDLSYYDEIYSAGWSGQWTIPPYTGEYGFDLKVTARSTISSEPSGWYNTYHEDYTVAYSAKGDCDLNHVINIYDLIRMLNHLNGSQPFSVGPGQFAGDVDDDGDCDTGGDLVALLNMLGGGGLLAGTGVDQLKIEYPPAGLIQEILAVGKQYGWESKETLKKIEALINTYLEIK